jgi:N,N-dimethylformamidase
MQGLDDGNGSPHQFNADLHLVDWLHAQGYEFDVVSDEDLYREGLDVLEGYNVVLTGTHHEYWAERMLDALKAYLEGGGRLMYLAGNGFYWVTELEPEQGHTIEIRRRGPATRTWDAAPGEGHLSFTGELGGLWRYRNRAPQQLVGVGFTAQGTGAGRPYVRQPDSFGSRAAFVFEGIGDDELIGDFPCLVSSYGAAGFEIDRVDYGLGSPQRTMLLATATGFSDSFQHVSEEITVTTSMHGGTVSELVRADMVLLEYPNGGAVFSPASITWCGSLSYNGYDNNVSRITRNVLDRFAGPEPALRMGEGEMNTSNKPRP